MTLPSLELWFRADDGDETAPRAGRARPRLVGNEGSPAPTALRSSILDDPALIEQIREGDERSFDALYEATFPELWSLARRYVGTAVAEEIVQDVFLRVWERRRDWVIRTSVRGYLFGAVRNRALHYLEHAAVERRASARMIAEQDEPVAPPAHANELFDAIARAVHELPERQRAAIVLRIQRGLSHAELGEALGVSAAAAGVLVRKAEAKLRVALAEYLPGV